MRYNSEQLEELASKVDLVELIGQTEDLQRKGQNYFIKCPFHNYDDTPSLCINPATNKWHCFGCGAGSSVYDWVMRSYNKTFPEALQYVCDLVGEDVEEYIESESIAFLKQLKNQHSISNARQSSANDSINIRKTLNFTDDYLNKYSDELPEEWLAEDMTAEALRHYNIRIDHNANRIVYPVFDEDGNFIGVKGRTRLASYKELGLAKYINYHKIGTITYFQGWKEALQEVINRKSVYIFEGIKSCIKCYGWGIPNTVASETSALSDGQVKLLVKYGIPEVNICWDNDQKVQDIIRDPKIQMLKRFTNLYVVQCSKEFGEKMSPVDMGEQAFRKLLERRIKV